MVVAHGLHWQKQGPTQYKGQIEVATKLVSQPTQQHKAQDNETFRVCFIQTLHSHKYKRPVSTQLNKCQKC
eukprot:m.44772 g.44772  ORF g.44772 m.44772 type:complete len:71 (+) comp10850_c0_seq1:769-981(+)